MKKVLSILLALSLLFLVGCSGVSQEEYDKVVEERDALRQRVVELEQQLEGNAEPVVEDNTISETTTEMATEGNANSEEHPIEIVAEYSMKNKYTDTNTKITVIKNIGDVDLNIDTATSVFAEDGTLLSVDDSSVDCVGPGCTTVLTEFFDTEGEIAYFETEYEYEPSSYYRSGIQYISYVQTDVSGGAIFQVTNNGDEDISFAQGHILFFSGDELVDYDTCYFTDDDALLKAGDTVSKQIETRENFDRIEVYFTGSIM